MAEETGGTPSGGPPAFPGNAPPAPPVPPPVPPGPAAAPPPFPAPGVPFAPPGNFAAAPQAAYASWGLRLGGWLIDAVILIVVQFVVAALLPKHGAGVVRWTMRAHNGMVRHNHLSFLALGITAVVAIIYATVLFGGKRGQTVGMMAVGVRGLSGDHGGPVGYGRAFWRSLLEQVFRVTIIIWIVDMLFPLWDSRRQTLHDKAVGSVVVRARPGG